MIALLKSIALAAACCSCLVAQAANGEAQVQAPAVKASRELLEQKEAFVKRMLSDSPAVKRIEAGNSVEAKKYLAAAQANYDKAILAMRSGDLAGADQQFNDALRSLGRARQLAPNPLTRDVEQRMRYAQVLDSVESLRVSYQRHLQRVRGQPLGAAPSDPQLAEVARLIDSAKTLANGERIVQANKALGEAERKLMLALNRILGARTIEYAQRFETIAEEYAYELERNRSYADLVPIALAEFKPASEVIREVQYLLESNRQLREQAQQHAAKKDHRAAVGVLRGGTVHLQNALAVAGLRVPQDEKP